MLNNDDVIKLKTGISIYIQLQLKIFQKTVKTVDFLLRICYNRMRHWIFMTSE